LVDIHNLTVRDLRVAYIRLDSAQGVQIEAVGGEPQGRGGVRRFLDHGIFQSKEDRLWDKDTWPEPSRPHAIVEGVVIQGESSGYRVLPTMDIWRGLPEGMTALQGARVNVAAQVKGTGLPVQGTLTSNEKGHFSLFSEWEIPWKSLRIECEGYEPVEIPVSDLHDPTDQSYWSEHRVLVSLKRR